MSKLRVIVADDERPAREYLLGLLRTMPDVEIVGEAADGEAALKMIEELSPDLALLDLQMPELSGLEVIRSLDKNKMPLVAFVTAYDEFAVAAFELNAVDYLLKPVEGPRLAATLQRAAERIGKADWREREAERVSEATGNYEQSSGGLIQRIPVRKRDEIYLIPVGEVASIVADGELLRITTEDNARYDINYRLKDLEARLDPDRFIRLSRGAVVNADQITAISPLPGGTYLVSLNNGQEIASSRLQSKMLRSTLLKL